MLHLRPTYEETLAQFGHSTRFNLRYYRRRLARRMWLEFMDDVRSRITSAEFESLNAASLNPIGSAHEVKLRWTCSCELPDSFVVGLRSSEGKWLSLIGGWRQDTTTVLHWQLNAAGYEHDSIGTVMRSFFLEHEVARGTRELLIFGGTPHTIRHAFKEDAIVDLVFCRDSLRSRICRSLARYLNRRKITFAFQSSRSHPGRTQPSTDYILTILHHALAGFRTRPVNSRVCFERNSPVSSTPLLSRLCAKLGLSTSRSPLPTQMF